MNPQMLKQIQKLQADMMERQQKLEETEFTGESAGVSITILGSKKVVDCKLSSEIVQDKEMLEDAICVAFNKAIDQVNSELEEILSSAKMPNFLGL